MQYDKSLIPEGLRHVEQVVQLVINERYDRVEATGKVAQLAGVSNQTILRQYTNGIGLRSVAAFDDLLYQPGLIELERYLADWFPKYRSQIMSFFKEIRSRS